MNPRIRRDIIGFYLTKQLHGKCFTQEEIKQIFQIKYRFSGFSGPTKYFKYKSQNRGKFVVRKCSLIQRQYVLNFFNVYGPEDLWRAYERHITGTNLYIYYDDDDDVSFWKLPKYGRTSEMLPLDIEESHINKNIKNRPQVILLLKMVKMKTTINPIQLKLFE